MTVHNENKSRIPYTNNANKNEIKNFDGHNFILYLLSHSWIIQMDSKYFVPNFNISFLYCIWPFEFDKFTRKIGHSIHVL